MADLSAFSQEQLLSLKEKLKGETQVYQNSYNQLAQVMKKYQGCLKSLVAVKDDQLEAKSMVPLTESIYVLANLNRQEDKFLIDVGTGYYAEVSGTEARSFYERKSAELEQTLAAIEQNFTKRLAILQSVEEKIKTKAC